MGVDGHVPCSTRETLLLTVGDVLFGARITEVLGHSKIDNVHSIVLGNPHLSQQKVVWFDVSVDEVLHVDVLDTRNLNSIKDKEYLERHTIWMAK